jgi:hypothetical protein
MINEFNKHFESLEGGERKGRSSIPILAMLLSVYRWELLGVCTQRQPFIYYEPSVCFYYGTVCIHIRRTNTNLIAAVIFAFLALLRSQQLTYASRHLNTMHLGIKFSCVCTCVGGH